MATNLDDITAIRTAFLEFWDPNVHVVFDNEPPIAESKTIWARLSVNPGHQKRLSFAANTWEQVGRVYLQVFVPAGTADSAGWNLAEAFIDNFREIYLDNCRIRFTGGADFRAHDADSEDPYYMIFVSMPYRSTH